MMAYKDQATMERLVADQQRAIAKLKRERDKLEDRLMAEQSESIMSRELLGEAHTLNKQLVEACEDAIERFSHLLGIAPEDCVSGDCEKLRAAVDAARRLK